MNEVLQVTLSCEARVFVVVDLCSTHSIAATHPLHGFLQEDAITEEDISVSALRHTYAMCFLSFSRVTRSSIPLLELSTGRT